MEKRLFFLKLYFEILLKALQNLWLFTTFELTLQRYAEKFMRIQADGMCAFSLGKRPSMILLKLNL
ncbi:MAG: hypothetical protein ABFC90_04710 [Bacteroidales bacterium]|nr:hypothetical protein [Bacteroidales bacterium]MDD2612254.1 hypothetical protein [Bacteroidales bacterium]MDD3907576.1 hypothetical protein [Bacteroidales bacterium]MDD4428885.1 hypothetical protein [Paludibacter sp.]